MSKLNFEFDEFPQLESERFILREVKEQDYISLFEIYSDEDAVKYQQTSAMRTIEQAHKSVQAFLNGFKNRKFIRWCIATKENDTVIGLHRIEASIHPDNIASIKLSEKLGFQTEGLKKEAAYNKRTDEYEDRLIFGITKNHKV